MENFKVFLIIFFISCLNLKIYINFFQIVFSTFIHNSHNQLRGITFSVGNLRTLRRWQINLNKNYFHNHLLEMYLKYKLLLVYFKIL